MPLPLAAIALGASALQGIMGGVQAFTSGAKRNERELERMAGQSPTYSGSRELEGFYNEALRRYQQSPYQSAKFIMGRNLAERSQANALGALTQRNSALAGAGRLASVGANQANQLVAQAEAERRQDFGMLGQAGRSLAQDKLTRFDINEMTPFNRKFGLQQMRTQAANERKNAGLQMIGGALGNAAMLGMSIPETPKPPASTWSSLGSNNSVVSLNEYRPRNTRSMNAPTSFSGRPLKIR
jgi:hypothetical protein